MTQSQLLSDLKSRLAPLRSALADHPVYEQLDRVGPIRVFMEHHVYAVWDFMSLARALRGSLEGGGIPWSPSPHPDGLRMIHEIMLAEETDDDAADGYSSHFELYHRAMVDAGADDRCLQAFLEGVQKGIPVRTCLSKSQVPRVAREFVLNTFDIIEGAHVAGLAASFVFGREMLLPSVFSRVVAAIDDCERLSAFRYYLERHIDLDGSEHALLGEKLVKSICGDNVINWRVAEESAIRSLQARRQLWDGIGVAIAKTSTENRRGHALGSP